MNINEMRVQLEAAITKSLPGGRPVRVHVAYDEAGVTFVVTVGLAWWNRREENLALDSMNLREWEWAQVVCDHYLDARAKYLASHNPTTAMEKL